MNTGSTFVLTPNNTYTMTGSNNLAFVLYGGSDTIHGDGKELTVHIGRAGGAIAITDFKGVIGLVPSLGFTSDRDALHHVVADGHGGSLLSFKGGGVDLVGIAPSSLRAGNFHIDNFHFAPFA